MGFKIVFKKEEEKLFLRYWQEIIDKAKVSSKYLPLNLETNLALSKDRSLLIRDKSFIYARNDQPVAGVFLPIEENDGYFTITITNYYVDAPILIDRLVEGKIFSIIDEIAKENNVAKIMFSADPLDRAIDYNYLQKYDYLDTSILNYVIDLQIKNLFVALRRNHQRNIKRILQDQDFSVFAINQDTSSYEKHEEFRELHHKCAGRVTAPKEVFDLQFEKLKQGQAVLFGLKYKGKNIAYMYFDYAHNNAVSYQAADDPEYDKLPLYHVLTFTAMEYLQKHGIKYIDTGQPSGISHQIGYYPDQKQLNIGLFKYGFGGDFRNLFRGVKYFSKTLFAEDMGEFVDSYKTQ